MAMRQCGNAIQIEDEDIEDPIGFLSNHIDPIKISKVGIRVDVSLADRHLALSDIRAMSSLVQVLHCSIIPSPICEGCHVSWDLRDALGHRVFGKRFASRI